MRAQLGSSTRATSAYDAASASWKGRVPVMPVPHSPTYATCWPRNAASASSASDASPGDGMHTSSVDAPCPPRLSALPYVTAAAADQLRSGGAMSSATTAARPPPRATATLRTSAAQ
eukprot:1210475-Prymnesium_polylepis.2